MLARGGSTGEPNPMDGGEEFLLGYRSLRPALAFGGCPIKMLTMY